MAKSGYATWNIDRIGTGLSSHPSGLALSVYSGAFVVHELVQDLRNSGVGGAPFGKVVLTGHSLGSVIAWAEAARYQDVDGTVITGMDHSPTIISAPGAPYFTELTFPARLDPNPNLRDRDLTYLTTIPGLRGGPLFYNAADTDPEVTKVDESTKDTITVLELATFAGPMIDGSAMKIRVPTLSVMGGQDGIFCGKVAAVDCSSSESLRAHEAKYYAPDTPLEAYALPGSGHDINLHRNAPDWFAVAARWMGQYFQG
jgi:pimeloyl-ACP methyl ester carboxylesterase